jgi:pSer/pThr/pTyr-binding forkhead associated (FHA) protein
MAGSGSESALNFAESDKFAAACRAEGLVGLRIVRNDGVVVAQGEIDLPMAVIGRGQECTIQLNDPGVSLRHGFLQVFNGHVLISDLGSRDGVSDGQHKLPFVWISEKQACHIGPFRIYLSRPMSDLPPPEQFNPFQPLPTDLLPKMVKFSLRFVNGRTALTEWNVNRGVTLVGRSSVCKINLGADDVDPYHCYFVMTPMGLWVVDLMSGCPVVVNGEPIQFARLSDGDIVEIARFKLQCLSRADNAATKKQATAALKAPIPVVSKPSKLGSGDSSIYEVSPPSSTAALVSTGNSSSVNQFDPNLQPVVKQMELAQQQMLDQFQSSMMMMMQMFGNMHQEQLSTMQQEVTRLTELTAELQKLQSTAPVPLAIGPSESGRFPDLQTVSKVNDESAAQHQWMYDRMAALQQERQSIWSRLSSLISRPATT